MRLASSYSDSLKMETISSGYSSRPLNLEVFPHFGPSTVICGLVDYHFDVLGASTHSSLAAANLSHASF